jgi:hypothetical protein
MKVPYVEARLSPGEAIDRWTILCIKAERLPMGKAQEHVWDDLKAMGAVLLRAFPPADDNLKALIEGLRQTNERIWQIEDVLRRCERRKDFGEVFVTNARAAYQVNDERHALKRRINEYLCAEIVEEKHHA